MRGLIELSEELQTGQQRIRVGLGAGIRAQIGHLVCGVLIPGFAVVDR